MSTFGDRLRDLRKEKNLMQSEFGELFNLSPSAVGSYERNLREPQYHHLVSFADFYNVSVDYLLCRTDERLTVYNYISKDSFQFKDLLDKYTIFINDYELKLDDKARLNDVCVALFIHKTNML